MKPTAALPTLQALCQQPAGVRGPGDLHPTGQYNSALYQEIWRPQGFLSRLEAVLRGRQGGLLGSRVLYRGPGDPAFTADESRRRAALLPMLAQALEADGQARPATPGRTRPAPSRPRPCC